ncbi:NmrA family NAD(P)-binding protein [Dyadobacter arcticus]|uniref:Uncharacterized protein YbjT (DUF2867 family) n=1 Tax=Dyadobacter arcticus TaxID=1078754 RepID=A0ABX0UST6_9BACT|nr:NAD(P)H-binding protein [Dyadobacter arcticus]NIJ54740.1 uncharacterized protein YbjT (DUF2867 family) [Dyadobacter arcticus]
MKNFQEINTKQVLVLGGTGKTGRRVAEKLSQLGISVRIGSRSATPSFDWLDSSTWGTALEGMDAIYISYQPDLAVPGAVDVVSSLIESAKTAGILKYVLLSGRGEEEAQLTEQVLMNASVNYTIIRASWFNQNFSEGYLLDPIAGGYMTLPVGDVGEPFIDVDDIADIAVAAFTNTAHDGKLYEVTGPRLLTFKEAVQEIASATGRNIHYEQISSQDYQQMMRQYEVPEDAIGFISYLFEEVLDGRNAYITDDVFRALGRKAKDFSEFARETAASGVWEGELKEN